MDRVFDYESKGRRFESSLAHQANSPRNRITAAPVGYCYIFTSTAFYRVLSCIIEFHVPNMCHYFVPITVQIALIYRQSAFFICAKKHNFRRILMKERYFGGRFEMVVGYIRRTISYILRCLQRRLWWLVCFSKVKSFSFYHSCIFG